jgi:hypothetical protein
MIWLEVEMSFNADTLTRVTAVLAAVAVTAVAAMISYEHTVDVVTRHGAAGLTGHLYSVVIDGQLVVASMVIADSARRGIRAGALAWVMLAAGIVATITVNLLSGTEYGTLGAIIAAWPAAAFAGTYEPLGRPGGHTGPDPDRGRAVLPRTRTRQAAQSESGRTARPGTGAGHGAPPGQ